jgi:hypothetical protein
MDIDTSCPHCGFWYTRMAIFEGVGRPNPTNALAEYCPSCGKVIQFLDLVAAR